MLAIPVEYDRADRLHDREATRGLPEAPFMGARRPFKTAVHDVRSLEGLATSP